MRPSITVAAVIEENGRFLLVEENNGQGIGVYNQPAGHLEQGESLSEAVIRETLEETAYHIKPTHLLGVYRWRPNAARTYLRFAFIARCLSKAAGQSLDQGILRAEWFTLREIEALREKHRSPMV